MNEKKLEEKLLREVMQWLGLQIGISNMGKYDTYKRSDFKRLEDFLKGDKKNENSKENIYGVSSDINFERFWDRINSPKTVNSNEDEKKELGKVRKILVAIVMLNRNPYLKIDIIKRYSSYEPNEDLWKEYKKIQEKESQLVSNEDLSIYNEIDNNNEKIPMPINESTNKLKKNSIRLLGFIGILLFFLLAWNFLKTKLRMTPTGEPVAEWNMYFRMRDENSLWKYPKLTFYKPLLGEENTFIVKAIGLYRKKGADTSDSTFNHSGKAYKVGEFLHITLTPDDPKQYNTFGNWEAQVYVGGNDFEIGKLESCLGLGGGISGYKEDKTTIKQGKFVVYCKQAIDKPKPDSVIFQEMYQYIKTDTFKMKLDRLNTDKIDKELIIRQGIRMNH